MELGLTVVLPPHLWQCALAANCSAPSAPNPAWPPHGLCHPGLQLIFRHQSPLQGAGSGSVPVRHTSSKQLRTRCGSSCPHSGLVAPKLFLWVIHQGRASLSPPIQVPMPFHTKRLQRLWGSAVCLGSDSRAKRRETDFSAPENRQMCKCQNASSR